MLTGTTEEHPVDKEMTTVWVLQGVLCVAGYLDTSFVRRSPTLQHPSPCWQMSPQELGCQLLVC